MKENEKEYNPSVCVHLRERVQVCKPQEVVLIVVHAQVSWQEFPEPSLRFQKPNNRQEQAIKTLVNYQKQIANRHHKSQE